MRPFWIGISAAGAERQPERRGQTNSVHKEWEPGAFRSAGCGRAAAPGRNTGRTRCDSRGAGSNRFSLVDQVVNSVAQWLPRFRQLGAVELTLGNQQLLPQQELV